MTHDPLLMFVYAVTGIIVATILTGLKVGYGKAGKLEIISFWLVTAVCWPGFLLVVSLAFVFFAARAWGKDLRPKEPPSDD